MRGIRHVRKRVQHEQPVAHDVAAHVDDVPAERREQRRRLSLVAGLEQLAKGESRRPVEDDPHHAARSHARVGSRVLVKRNLTAFHEEDGCLMKPRLTEAGDGMRQQDVADARRRALVRREGQSG